MKRMNKKRFISVILMLLLVVMMIEKTKSRAAQPSVNLGTTATFAVLAGTTITNIGTTTINGDVGGNVGIFPGTSFTGQETISISGALHIADEVANKAQTDLVNAYDDAAARQPVTRIPTELGGTTLTPGIYDSADGRFQITGTLTLDAQGDPEGVFVFKTDSTLITASDSSVNLINSARFCRTFWKVGSSATLGSNSHFVGHILALTSISANTGAFIQGQLMARNGAVTLSANTITNGICEIISATATPTPTATATPIPTTTPTTPNPTEKETLEKETIEKVIANATVTPRPTTITGGELPKTSTPWYNLLLAGVVILLVGTIGWKTRKRYL